MMKKRAWLWHGLVLLVLAVLLTWALRNAPLAAIQTTIQRLRPWQIGILALVNAGLYMLVSLRWWIIVRAEAKKVPYWPLLGVRVAVFGVSYFTLGPQVGGEPLQVLALQRSYGLSFSRATASVLMDKLLEFLVNFLLLALGMAAVTQAGLLEQQSMRVTGSMALVGVLVAWPPVHITLMYRRIYPISAILRALRFIPRQNRLVRFLRAAEWLAGTFCQRHPRALFASLGVSLLAGAGMLLDYGLMLAFLGIDLPFWKTVAGWTAGWLSFLAPLPGGLGALEASQVFALGAFGIPAAASISLTLLMRARDLLIGGLGLTISIFRRGSIIN
jgi:hypothetical protein